MDNQGTESSGNEALNVDSAAREFSSLFDTPDEQNAKDLEKKEGEEGSQDPEKDNPEPEEPEAKPEPEAESGDVTIEVDGKTVTLTKEELAEAYKNGLRQSDYTKKTMEVAEQRRAAEAEMQKAQQERQAYAQNLAKLGAQIEGSLDQFKNIDWGTLSVQDPVEYIRLQHLYQERQAAMAKIQQDRQILDQINEQEHDKRMQTIQQFEQQELLAKLPEWKDNAKAVAEANAIRDYMLEQGFDKATVSNMMDHKAVILSRKAMLYDKMMAKADAASKKVAALPTKVQKPGVGEKPDTDSRKQLMDKLSKSGRVGDAANLFKSFI